MIDILLKYYNLNGCRLIDYGEGCIFFINGKKYYLTKTNYTENMVNEINSLVLLLHSKNIRVHKIIKNNSGYNLSDGYVLMEIYMFGDDISIEDIKIFNSFVGSIMYKDMNSFWYEKLDYLDKQRYELSTNSLINNSFDYYLGVAELLLKNLKNSYGQTRICLSHKSLNNLSVIEYYNPLNISYDVWLKDIGYYISITKDYHLLDTYLDKINKYELNYLFTRLCFPFKYFEEVANIIVDKKSERKLLKIITSFDDYEKHLFNMEHIFGIYLFEWIKK